MTGTAPVGVAVLTACAAALVLIARLWLGTTDDQPAETTAEPEPADCETTLTVSYDRLLHTVAPPVAVWPDPAPPVLACQTFGGRHRAGRAGR